MLVCFFPSYAQEELDEMPESMVSLEFTQNKHDLSELATHKFSPLFFLLDQG
jgi:hypothetical protein